MPTAPKPVIYQLVVRYFGNVNTANRRDGTLAVNGGGRFADITPAALAELRGLGATHVWLTGCLRQATLTDYSALGLPADDPDVVKGIAGSFYAVRDAFDVCSDYATDPARRLAEELDHGRLPRVSAEPDEPRLRDRVNVPRFCLSCGGRAVSSTAGPRSA